MKIIKREIIDRNNEIEMTILEWTSPYGLRYGYELAVAETDPFIEAHGDGTNGFTSASEAEVEARRMWASFSPGDELCQGVFKV